MNGVSLSWQQPAQMTIAGGSFSRVLSQPMMNAPPKIVSEQTFVSVQPSPIASVNILAQSPEFQPSMGGMMPQQTAHLSMQADVASQITGAISHGIGYDAKTGHSIGGNPQYIGTKFGNAVESATAAQESDSIYSFSYGSITAITVRPPTGDFGAAQQDGDKNNAQKSRFFDWKAYYNARLFARIMQKAPLSDHRAGLKKMKPLIFGGDGYDGITDSELLAFLKALQQKNSNKGLISHSYQKICANPLPKLKNSIQTNSDEESFWGIYGK